MKQIILKGPRYVIVLTLMLICSSITAQDFAPFHSQCQTTQDHLINVALTHSDTIPLPNLGTIYSLSINANIWQPKEASFARIILEDTNGHNYLVAESDWFRNDTTIVNLTEYCEETALLDGIVPLRLKCYLAEEAEVEITSMHISHQIPSRSLNLIDGSKIAIKRSQVQNVVDRINAYNRKHHKLWRAGVTAQSILSYEEQEYKCNINAYLANFKYYCAGFYEIGERSLSEPKTSTNYVDSFDWRYRHGHNESNSWVTSVKFQGLTDWCATFASVGLAEVMTNLYYNMVIDSLDLSEQDIAVNIQQLYSDTLQWNHTLNVLGYICSYGVIDEATLPFTYENYPQYNGPRPEGNELIKANSIITFQGELNEETLKRRIIQAPYVSSIKDNDGAGHAMLLVGFNRVQPGSYGLFPNTIYVPQNSPLIGCNYWIFKNSWGLVGNNGYAYIIVNDYNYMGLPYSIGPPILSKNLTSDDIICEDLDNDGLFNWGIGSWPPNIPRWYRRDGDDSNANLGWINNYGHSVEICPAGTEQWVISADTTIAISQYNFKNIIVLEGQTMTIISDIVMHPASQIRLMSGAKLIVDNGQIINANIVPSSGSAITLRNGGVIKMPRNHDFLLPVGVSLEISEGAIENYDI